MHLLFLRIFLKAIHLLRRTAIGHLDAIRRSQGFDGVVRLLARVEGADAIQVLRSCGAQVGAGTRISEGLTLHNADASFANLQIGMHCHLGRQLLLDLASPVQIGNRVTISMRCNVLTHADAGDSRCGLRSMREPVRIDDDAYLGAAVTVLPGVHIGAGAIVAAGAVVTRDVAPHSAVAGVPAKPLARASAGHQQDPQSAPEAETP
jgi:acetyltransferase-like isoleucine patch superfamily enzyme